MKKMQSQDSSNAKKGPYIEEKQESIAVTNNTDTAFRPNKFALSNKTCESF